MFRIAVIGDTHIKRIEQLPKVMLQELNNSNLIVHCGDFTGMDLLRDLQKLGVEFIGVYGNTDPAEIRNSIGNRVTFEVEGKSIAVMHPYWGGPPFGMEAELLSIFPDADIILFGHTHEASYSRINKTLLVNPGQGYSSFFEPATMAIIEFDSGQAKVEILKFA